MYLQTRAFTQPFEVILDLSLSSDIFTFQAMSFTTFKSGLSTLYAPTTGETLSQIITGTSGNDTLIGGGTDDIIEGLDGDDYLDGGAGYDRVTYYSSLVGVTVDMRLTTAQDTIGAGIDTILNFEELEGTRANDTLTGDANNNRFFAWEGDDVVHAGDGWDTVHGFDGDDTLYGEGGNDTLFGADGDDILDGGTGNDELRGGLGQDTLNGGDGDDELYADGTGLVAADPTGGIDILNGDAGNDRLIGDEGNDILTGGTGDDFLFGGEGADTLDGGDGIDTLSYSDGVDLTINLSTNSVSGGDANGDTISGFENVSTGNGDDHITGDNGANHISGGRGRDQLFGLGGDDTFLLGRGDGIINGGTGTDTVELIGADLSLYTLTKVADGHYTLSSSNFQDSGTNTLYDIEFLMHDGITYDIRAGFATGLTQGDDVYTGTANADNVNGIGGNDNMNGLGGDDRLNGEFGDDIIEGGAGADELIGGDGMDTLSYAGSAVGVSVNLSTGSASRGDAEGDSFIGFEHLTGSAQIDTLTGDAGGNTIQGLGGDDSIIGLAGNNTLDGGGGTDTAVYIGAVDSIVQNPDNSFTVTYTPNGTTYTDRLVNIEFLRDATGTIDLSNLTSWTFLTPGNRVYSGTSGDDQFVGTSGDDSIGGQAGDDNLRGEDGNDQIEGGAGSDIIDGGAGFDVARYSGSRHDYSVTLNNDGSYSVASNSGPDVDTLSGIEQIHFAGATMFLESGFAGTPSNDIYLLSGSLIDLGAFNSGDGNDSFESTAGVVNISNAAIDLGAGHDQFVLDFDGLFGLRGGDGNDYLQGVSHGFDFLRFYGDAGHDTFQFGIESFTDPLMRFGQIFLHGGTGDDTYNLTSVRVGALEEAAEGTDTVNLIGPDWNGYEEFVLIPATQPPFADFFGVITITPTYILPDNVENLNMVTGFKARGNDLDNIINGNTQDNVISGLGGDDIISGGDGDDTINGGDGNDTITGGGGSDVIDGGGGTDIAVFLGNRSDYNISANSHGALLVENIASGDIDTVRNVEQFQFDDEIVTVRAGFYEDSRDITINGTSGNDIFAYGITLTANEFNQFGTVTLNGGSGDDVYNVVTPERVYVIEDMGEGVDTVNLTGSLWLGYTRHFPFLIGAQPVNIIPTYTLPDNVENLNMVTGFDAFGNDLDNIITGNAQDNVISGLGGDDVITAGGGNDLIDGGDGSDIAIFSGNVADYDLSIDLDGVLTVTHSNGGSDGVDTLTSIETLRFADGDVSANQVSDSTPIAFFTANGGPATGAELYQIEQDGSVSLVADINTGAASSNPRDFTEFAGFIYFSATTNSIDANIYRVDGAGTVEQISNLTVALNAAFSGFHKFNNYLYFGASDGVSGTELYKIDSSGGVTRVADIEMGAESSDPQIFVEAGGFLYFTADNGIQGEQLFRVDNNDNVVRLSGYTSEQNNFDPRSLADVNGELYFSAQTSNLGRELYKVNAQGDIELVADISGPVDTSPFTTDNRSSDPQDFIELNGVHYFVARDEGAGEAIHRLNADGTVELVADVNTGRDFTRPNQLTVFNGELYFVATDTTFGSELFKIDTNGNTVRLTDLRQGGGDSNPYALIVFDNALYFAADGDGVGVELYRYSSGTVSLVADINPGAADSRPDNFAVVDNHLFFRAEDPANGSELYFLNANGVPELVADINTGPEDSGPVRITPVPTPPQLGTPSADTLQGTSDDDIIFGLAGNDTINGADGDDILNGDDGNDVLFGDDGDDVLNGGDGNDALYGNAGADSLNGGNGNDNLYGDVSDTFNGGAGFDTVYIQDLNAAALVRTFSDAQGVERVYATNLDDMLDGSGLTNSIIYFGLDGNDTLIGGSGNDYMDGGAGDDVMNGGDGVSDWVSYQSATGRVFVDLSITGPQNTVGAGVDTLSGFENVEGSNFNDRIWGDSGHNYLYGMAGNDVIDGGAGNDVMDGGAGADRVSYASATSRVIIDLGITGAQNTRGAGVDRLSNFEQVEGSAFRDILYGNAQSNYILGGDGNDYIDGGGGSDFLDGGAGGADWVSFRSSSVGLTIDMSNAGAQASGNILVNFENLEGTDFDDELIGDAGNNYIDGLTGIDVIDGGAGNDILVGGTEMGDTVSYQSATSRVFVNLGIAGAQNTGGNGIDTLSGFENLQGSNFSDRLTGDSGNNILLGGAGNDVLDGGAGDDVIDGGTGADRVSYASSASRVVVDLNIVGQQNTQGAGFDTLVNIEQVLGSDHRDVLIGDFFSNYILGGDGNDYIDGGDSGDVLDGGAGTSDWVSFQSSSTGVTVDLSNTGVQATNDIISNFENLEGSDFNDVLTGDAGNNYIDGQDGDDVVNGGAGNDSLNGGGNDDLLEGGVGNDTLRGGTGVDFAFYESGNINDFAVTDNGGGHFTVSHSIWGTDELYDVEFLRIGTANYALSRNITGTDGDDTIQGMFGDDVLFGLGGNDMIFGNGGNDVLDGGAGNDLLDGGAGMDRASYVDAGSAVWIDMSITGYQDTRGAGLDQLVSIEEVEGSAFRDILYGNSESNYILGGDGNDYIDGGGSGDVLDGGAGTSDWVSFQTSRTRVTIDLSNTGVQATGDILINFENLEGSNNSDVLIGDSGDNYIVGMVGNDTIDGGAGNDIMIGGSTTATGFGSSSGTGGDLVSYMSAASGVVVNLGLLTPQDTIGAGIDTIMSFGNLEGSNFDDVLRGNDFSNRIMGGAGNDLIIGGEGSDVIDGGAGVDRVSYADATGTILLDLSITGLQRTIGSGIVTLISIEDVEGSAFNDNLLGNASANYIFGGAGNDYIDGGGNANVLDGGEGISDWVSYQRSTSGVNIDLSNTGEQSTLDIIRNFENLEGSDFGDTLTGDSGSNFIDGQDGADIINGGLGNDVLTGGSGADQFLFEAGFGADRVTDFVDGTDGLQFNIAGLTQFSQLSVTQDGADTLVSYNGNIVRLQNTTATDITDADVSFVAPPPAEPSDDATLLAEKNTNPDIVSDITDVFVESDSFVFKAKDDLPIVSDVLDDAELTDVTGEPIEATAEQLKAFAAAQFMAPLTDLSEMSVMDSDTDWLTTQAQDPNYWDMVS